MSTRKSGKKKTLAGNHAITYRGDEQRLPLRVGAQSRDERTVRVHAFTLRGGEQLGGLVLHVESEAHKARLHHVEDLTGVRGKLCANEQHTVDQVLCSQHHVQEGSDAAVRLVGRLDMLTRLERHGLFWEKGRRVGVRACVRA
jgi:hypothetical protein